MITYLTGDLLTTSADYIVHQANCRGVMGAGLAKQIRIMNPDLYNRYRRFCSTYKPTDLLGRAFICNNIITVFGQLNYGYDRTVVYTSYTALQRAFTNIHKRLPLDCTIAFPYNFGCGLANGDWNTVLQLIISCFPDRTIYIVKKSATN